MAAPGERKHLLRLTFSILGILIGVSIFCVFGFKYHNWNTALWGLMSAIPAAVTLYVHLGNKQRKWDTCPDRLKTYMLMGCFTQLAGVCGFVTYITLAVTNHQGMVIYGSGYYLTSVWCFMTWKWGFLLFYYSRFYKQQYYHVYTILPKDEEVNSYGGHQ